MFHPLPIAIGLRYTRAKKQNNFVSFVSFASIGGIALGIATMIVVLSVMNGFIAEMREKTLSMSSHASIEVFDNALPDWSYFSDIALQNKNVLATAPFVQGQGLLTQQRAMAPVQIQGIDPALEGQVSEVESKLMQGKLADLSAHSFGIILGEVLADKLGVGIGDKVSLITPELNVTGAGVMPRLKRFEVKGFFNSGVYEYDSAVALININDAAVLYKLPEGAVTGVRLKLADVLAAKQTSQALADSIGSRHVFVRDWTQTYASLFAAVRNEKNTLFFIMSLIIAVAVFNLVSTLVMVVTEKRADIAILRTLGMTPRAIMGVFMVQGVIIGFLGTVIGLLLGVTLAINANSIVNSISRLMGTDLFNGEIHFLRELPSRVMLGDVAAVAIIAFLLASIATLYPAWKAARTQPAEALRYE